MASVSLKPVDDADRLRISHWLSQPNLRARWGTQSGAGTEIERIIASDIALVRLILDNRGQPCGFAYAVDATEWGQDLPQGLPRGTWEVEVFAATSAGQAPAIETATWPLLIDLVFRERPAAALATFVEITNEATIRLLEELGFFWDSIEEHPTRGRGWFMVATAPEYVQKFD